MDILKAQFLISCRAFTNGTYHYDNYVMSAKVGLRNIIVRGMPFYDTLSLFCYDSFACL